MAISKNFNPGGARLYRAARGSLYGPLRKQVKPGGVRQVHLTRCLHTLVAARGAREGLWLERGDARMQIERLTRSLTRFLIFRFAPSVVQVRGARSDGDRF